MARRDLGAVRITSATRSHSVDVRRRQRRYLVSMGIRSLCFLAAVLVWLALGQGWLVWSLIGASLFLPYVAVVMANVGFSPDTDGPAPYDAGEPRPALEAGRGSTRES